MQNFLNVMLLTGAGVISTLPRSHNSTQELDRKQLSMLI